MSGSADNRPRFTRGHSCVPCYQRKVKCDGQRPCSKCVSHSRTSECQTARPTTSVRLSVANQEAVLLRLRRYENLLVANGIPLEAQESAGETDARAALETVEGDNGHIIIQRGHPRFVDNVIWNRLGSELADEVPDSSEAGDSGLDEEDEPDSPESLLFGPGASTNTLASVRPSIQQIFRLWQTFLDNFNPLTKILHVPTTQQTISNAVADAQGPDASTEALLFAIYLCAIMTMSNEECASYLGESRRDLFQRFSRATKQALRTARFLQTGDIVVLQALTLYLLASRSCINDQSLWLLTGIASRLGQSMGLHREQSLKHLSPFDAEIRRRLWWQITILEHQSAQMSGAKFDVVFTDAGDTKRPLNLSDSSLSPFMREIPSEHDGPTEMLFCRIRFEIGECMRQVKIAEKARKTAPTTSAAQAEQAINELEAKLEGSLLKRCDASIPLHLLSTLMARSAVCQMRLSVRQTSHMQKQSASADLSEDSRQGQFQLALQILEYDRLACSTRSLQPFLWHVSNNFPFQGFIQVLTHLLHWAQGDEVEQAWAVINQAYDSRPGLVGDAKKPLSIALGNLVLKAWERRSARADMRSLTTPYPVASAAIAKLRARKPSRALNGVDLPMMSGIQTGIELSNESNLDWTQLLNLDESEVGWGSW